MTVPYWNPTGIKYLSGVNWLNIFGQEYISFFGHQKLTQLPGYRVEFVSDGRWFWLQPTERPEEMFTSEGLDLANRIKYQLGGNAFYDFSSSVDAMFKKYDAPVFDYSEIRLP